MSQTPFGDDRTAARDDACGALRRQRDERQTNSGVNRKIINALLGLLNERVAEDFPGQVFGLARDFFESLINRHSADGDGRIADDPFARGVDVFAGGEIHHRVGAPLRSPSHLLDFFFNRRGDRGVADVGVDLDQKVSANSHRLGFGVIDVGGNDRAPARDFIANKFGRDELRDARAKAFTAMLVIEAVALAVGQSVKRHLPSEVFTDGDEFHFGSDDAATSVMHLRDGVAGPGAQRLPAQSRKLFELASGFFACVSGFFNRAVAVVFGFDRAAFVLFHVAASDDPLAAQGGQSVAHVALERGIAPRAACVVNADGIVDFNLAVEAFGYVLRDFAERHVDTGLRTGDVDALGIWKLCFER
ncbi:MAG: hypothetical protein JMDDDDMK_04576 [Acidobacteria bacterium]|nr:hypothetical protein [Acidobacteriota bacterium]